MLAFQAGRFALNVSFPVSLPQLGQRNFSLFCFADPGRFGGALQRFVFAQFGYIGCPL